MTLVASEHSHDIHNYNFSDVLDATQAGFIAALQHGPIFKTDAEDLFTLHLDNLPVRNADERQYFNCSACKNFINTYGNLVVVDDNGDLVPIAWQMVDSGFYQSSIDALRDKVSKAKIVAAFHTAETLWGIPTNNGWSHFSLNPPFNQKKSAFRSDANEKMALSKEKRRIVVSSFADIKPSVLDEALRVLKSDTLDRSDRFIAPLQWLRDLHDRPKGPRGNNLLWKAVTLAPEGFCHPRSAVTSTLLNDIEAGLSFDVISRKWSDKMHPLRYQRPQAAPSAGTIAQAEKLIEDLGVARSLERRYATLDEVKTIWSPTAIEEKPKASGIFAHLKKKDTNTLQQVELPAKNINWTRFVETILSTAKLIQMQIPMRGGFTGVLTAEHSDAPPILQWDHEDNRYPISTYVYHKGSQASVWGLTPGAWEDVTGIMPTPSSPGEEGNSFILIVAGAKDQITGQGNGLFPEMMKSELHGIRSVIEAYSKTAVMGGRENASANGLGVNKGNTHHFLKVNDGTGWATYHIDRWE